MSRHLITYKPDTLLCNMTDTLAFHFYAFPSAALIYVASLLLFLLVPILAIYAAKSAYTTANEGYRCVAAIKFLRLVLQGKWRLIALAVYTGFGLGFPAGVLLYYTVNQDNIEKNYLDYFTCLIQSQPSCPRRPIISFPLQLAMYLLIMLVGTVYGALSLDRTIIRVLSSLFFHCERHKEEKASVEEWTQSWDDADISYTSMTTDDDISSNL